MRLRALGGLIFLLNLSRVDPLIKPVGGIVRRRDMHRVTLPGADGRDDEENGGGGPEQFRAQAGAGDTPDCTEDH